MPQDFFGDKSPTRTAPPALPAPAEQLPSFLDKSGRPQSMPQLANQFRQQGVPDVPFVPTHLTPEISEEEARHIWSRQKIERYAIAADVIDVAFKQALPAFEATSAEHILQVAKAKGINPYLALSRTMKGIFTPAIDTAIDIYKNAPQESKEKGAYRRIDNLLGSGRKHKLTGSTTSWFFQTGGETASKVLPEFAHVIKNAWELPTAWQETLFAGNPPEATPEGMTEVFHNSFGTLSFWYKMQFEEFQKHWVGLQAKPYVHLRTENFRFSTDPQGNIRIHLHDDAKEIRGRIPSSSAGPGSGSGVLQEKKGNETYQCPASVAFTDNEDPHSVIRKTMDWVEGILPTIYKADLA